MALPDVIAQTAAESRGPGQGFTFIEMIVSLAIFAVLALLATPALQLATQRDKEHELRSALVKLREGIDAYKRAADQGRIRLQPGDSGYPKSLDELRDGVPDQKSIQNNLIYFMRALPRDPMHPDPGLPAADTWLKRSYASPPDEPAEGSDVFDVHSRSDRVGLNGVPYSRW